MSFVHDLEELIASSDNPLLAAHPSWERVPLGSVATVQNGAAFESSKFSATKGTPLIRIRDLERGSTACLYDGSYDRELLVNSGDLLVGMDGDFRVARWTGKAGLLNQRVCRIRVRPEYYDERLLELVLQGYLDAIHRSTSSQTVTHLSSRTIAAIPLPLPPLAEQQRIVAKVETLFTEVGTSREHLSNVPAILKRFKRSIFDAACSGRLTQRWRTENALQESASDLVHPDAEASDLPDADDHVEDIKLPASWVASRVDRIVRIQNGRAFPSKRYLGQGLRLLRPGNLGVNGRVEWSKENTVCLPSSWAREYPEFVLGGGELVMNLTAQSLKDEFLGRVCLKKDSLPALLNQRIARLSPLGEFDVRPYLLLYFKSSLFRSFVNELDTGSLIRHMHSKDVARHVVLLPPLREQGEIVRRATVLLGLADEIERQTASVITRTDLMPQTILAKVFRGELVPTEAELARQEDRDYESASVLLERIRENGAREGKESPSPETRAQRINQSNRNSNRRSQRPQSSKRHRYHR